MSLRFRVVALVMVVALTAIGCRAEEEGGGSADGGNANTGQINVFSAISPAENSALQDIWDENMADQVDYEVEFETSENFEEQVPIRAEGGTLDVILLPQPGAVVDHAASGNAVSLEDMGFDVAELEETFGEYFMSLGEHEGEHYGVPSNINLKSMVWYPKDDFDAAGYEVPTSHEELIALSDQIVADGGTPWCVGFESGSATGWPATDWMEDIMLRTAGPEVYDQWVNHEIPFDDPAVQRAAEVFGEYMFTDGYVLGGADQAPSISFEEAPLPMFEDPPNCWLHRQASFINALFPEGTEAGRDYDWFPFPPIEQEGTLFAGELAVAFRDAPEIRDFLDRFVNAEVQCAQGAVQGSSRISPNVDVGPDCYANEILADASEVLTGALEEGTGRFDASDLMPTAVGAGSFWTGMVRYMQEGADSREDVLSEIESTWPGN
jgi:alpha-glucoside transport system substrate-binding protein